MTTFLNPYTDFGFKKLFGEEASKPLLIDFLNALLPAHHQIAELEFRSPEKLGILETDRKAFYDLYCESVTGLKFIVELQKTPQNYYIDRSIYYSSLAIQTQAKKGQWNYQLDAVYCVSIIDFKFQYPIVEENNQFTKVDSPKPDVIHMGKIKNQYNQIIFDKLTYIYLEMPAFNKQDSELTTQLDKWLYFIKNLENFSDIPYIFKDTLFEQAFETAYIGKMTSDELLTYQRSLKVMWDNYAQNETSFDKGVEEGIEIGMERGMEKGMEIGEEKGVLKERLNNAKAMKQKGIDNATIADITGLTLEKVRQL